MAGCANLSEETANNLMVAPGKYDIYTCRELGPLIRTSAQREGELRGLMERAERGAGGAFVTAVAYRSDHLRARAELNLLNQTVAKKGCSSESLWSSERALQ